MTLTVNINGFLNHIDSYRICFNCYTINLDANDTCWHCGDVSMYDVRQIDITKLKLTFGDNNFNTMLMRVG